ncbi:MAG TPA: transposase [Candidatus Brocadiia bacterium]|nr:transposase [Candidatus Brocadiia bacterium]
MPNVAHHITQRGNRSEDVFFCDEDRNVFLALLSHYAARNGLSIQAYCLMSNHFHLVVTPETARSLGDALKPVLMRYAQHVNRSQGWTGRLWQGRFFSCALDEAHFWTAIRYVETNPVRARLVRKAQKYRWSSAAAHCGLRRDDLLSGVTDRAEAIGDWAVWLAGPAAAGEIEALRERTRTGRPLGDDKFVGGLERLLGRAVRAGKVGRPRKQDKRKT